VRAFLAAMAVLGVALAGCANAPKTWTRPDGAAILPAQLPLDEIACKGEANKANLSAAAKPR
jgi:hypothetical protein